MNVEATHEALAAKTIAELRAYAADQGISLPSKGRKADLIALTLDLLSSKVQPEPEPAEEEKAPTTTITLDCGHPFAVSHLDVLPANVKGYLAKAKKAASCPRCPAAVAEPEGEVSTKPEPIEEEPTDKERRAALVERFRAEGHDYGTAYEYADSAMESAPAPAPTKAQKSSAPRKPKAAKASKPTPTAPKAKKSAKPKKALKQEPRGWGFSSKEGGHADSSKALIRAKTPSAKASVAAELIEETGWTAKVVEESDEHAVLQATYGEALIVIRWQPLEAKKLDIRLYKTPDHKGRGLLNVSAALKACRAAVEISATTTDQAAPELTQVAA
jgi:hypothetical protein